jgi:hypothetical protein
MMSVAAWERCVGEPPGAALIEARLRRRLGARSIALVPA